MFSIYSRALNFLVSQHQLKYFNGKFFLNYGLFYAQVRSIRTHKMLPHKNLQGQYCVSYELHMGLKRTQILL